jgi:uncharacterized protein YndB with AHSA1/START domain
MADQSTSHVTFTIQGTYPVPPTQVFAAFADPKAKARWQNSDEASAADNTDDYLEFDFRVDGHEHFAFVNHDLTYSYDAEYFDIVPDQRIVYRYTMHANGKPDSISIALLPSYRPTAL